MEGLNQWWHRIKSELDVCQLHVVHTPTCVPRPFCSLCALEAIRLVYLTTTLSLRHAVKHCDHDALLTLDLGHTIFDSRGRRD